MKFENIKALELLQKCVWGPVVGEKAVVVQGLKTNFFDDSFELRLTNGVVITGKLSELSVSKSD